MQDTSKTESVSVWLLENPPIQMVVAVELEEPSTCKDLK